MPHDRKNPNKMQCLILTPIRRLGACPTSLPKGSLMTSLVGSYGFLIGLRITWGHDRDEIRRLLVRVRRRNRASSLHRQRAFGPEAGAGRLRHGEDHRPVDGRGPLGPRAAIRTRHGNSTKRCAACTSTRPAAYWASARNLFCATALLPYFANRTSCWWK